ncbi:MAG: ribonuclease catalytic domain-containing protein [Treponema sp.]
MLVKNTPVLYKRQAALVKEADGDKYVIEFQTAAQAAGKAPRYAEQKVREKDIIALHTEAVPSLRALLDAKDEGLEARIAEAYELLISDEESASSPIVFTELAGLCSASFSAEQSALFFESLAESREFRLDETAFKSGKLIFLPRTKDEIAELDRKRYEKEHLAEIRAEFIARLKARKLLLPDDAKFMGEIEALALGQTEKSKNMAEAGIAQSPENAHKVLLETGVWDVTKNPYPTRAGLSMTSADEGLGAPPEEERLELAETAYAIDSPWSADPDDAVSWDGTYLWIHIADPAAFVLPDSPADKSARARGTTLYIPEGAVRMLSEAALEDYALGLKAKSIALSFRILLDENNCIADCAVFKTQVNVARMTYEEADAQKDSPELAPLFDIARKNEARRKKSGANTIDMPEVHISLDAATKKVAIEPLVRFESDAMIREMMLLAGEGAAHFAFKNNIPFPYISQEPPEIAAGEGADALGLAEKFKILKSSHKRSVGVTPAMHAGLGLALYTQVTSPLRRYGDLVAHEQLRAFLSGQKLIGKDDMLLRISAGDAASLAARKAARQSDLHWKLVYLLQNPDWTGEGICIDRRNSDALVLIPSLAMQAWIKDDALALNGIVMLKAAKIDIPTLGAVFVKQEKGV